VESVYHGELLLWRASILESIYCGERRLTRYPSTTYGKLPTFVIPIVSRQLGLKKVLHFALECLFSNMVEMHQWLVLKPILHQFEDHIFTSLIQFLYIIGTCPQGPA
jgi:hypothetical protein